MAYIASKKTGNVTVPEEMIDNCAILERISTSYLHTRALKISLNKTIWSILSARSVIILYYYYNNLWVYIILQNKNEIQIVLLSIKENINLPIPIVPRISIPISLENLEIKFLKIYLYYITQGSIKRSNICCQNGYSLQKVSILDSVYVFLHWNELFVYTNLYHSAREVPDVANGIICAMYLLLPEYKIRQTKTTLVRFECFLRFHQKMLSWACIHFSISMTRFEYYVQNENNM